MRIILVGAPEDGVHLRALERHLAHAGLPNDTEIWHVGLVTAGADIQSEVAAHIAGGDLALVLQSADLNAAEQCQTMIGLLLQERESRPLPMWLILLRPVEYRAGPLVGLQTLPRNGQPITSWPDADCAWQDVAHALVEELPSEFAKHTAPECNLHPHDFVVHVIAGANVGLTRRLSANRCVVGRTPDADIYLSRERYCSVRHFSFVWDKGAHWAYDWGHPHSIFINDHRVPPHARVRLRLNDQIQLGQTIMKYERYAESGTNPQI